MMRGRSGSIRPGRSPGRCRPARRPCGARRLDAFPRAGGSPGRDKICLHPCSREKPMSHHPRPSFVLLGHASVRCDLPTGEIALIDPWVTTNPFCPEHLKKLPRLDAILITHAHGDHMADAVELALQFKPKIVAGFEICQWLGSKGVKNCSGMNLGGTQ